MAEPPSRYECERCGGRLEGHDGLTAEDLRRIHQGECPEGERAHSVPTN